MLYLARQRVISERGRHFEFHFSKLLSRSHYTLASIKEVSKTLIEYVGPRAWLMQRAAAFAALS